MIGGKKSEIRILKSPIFIIRIIILFLFRFRNTGVHQQKDATKNFVSTNDQIIK